MVRDWFRSESWSPEIAAEFEVRLARARAHNRPQYLRIQGVHLVRAGLVEPARELWRRVAAMEADEAFGQWPSAVEHLADSYRADDPGLAERWYRRLLSEHPSLNGTSFSAELSLAEVMVVQDRPDEALEAVMAWRSRRSPSPLPADVFRSSVISADAALALGDQKSAREEARRALRVADMPSPFWKHPEVGVVRTDAATLRRLRRIAGHRW